MVSSMELIELFVVLLRWIRNSFILVTRKSILLNSKQLWHQMDLLFILQVVYLFIFLFLLFLFLLFIAFYFWYFTHFVYFIIGNLSNANLIIIIYIGPYEGTLGDWSMYTISQLGKDIRPTMRLHNGQQPLVYGDPA